MYTAEELSNKTIYFFRCPRTGSTCIMAMLGFKLKGITKKIIPTHDFSILETMERDTNYFLLRTDRKDKTELFISSFISKRLLNIKNSNIFKKEEYDNLPSIQPIKITQRDIDLFMKEQIKIKHYWDSYASNYDNEIIYYEDALNVWNSNKLPVSISLTSKEDEQYITTFKLPYNKKEIIINYDEVDNIIKSEFGVIDVHT